MKYIQFPLVTMAVFGLMLMPQTADAATKKPTCELTLTTSVGSVTTHKDADVLLVSGSNLTIAWDSENAKKGVDGEGDTIALSGTETVSPNKTTTYDYRFTGSGSSKKVTCSVTAHVVTADITDSTLATSSSKPTISGTAEGTKTVRLIVKEDGETKTLFKSKNIKVKKGKWSAKISKPLSDGTYDITLLGDKKFDLATILTTSLVVGESGGSSSSSASSALSVSAVPLLFGSTVASGGSIPISYLKITNTSKSQASFSGAWVKQYGSAPTSVITALEVRDDKGVTRGKSESVSFGSSGAFAPADVILGAGETRLFTIRATLSSTASSYAGKQLMLSVASIKTSGAAKGAFPIAGTTWTIR